MSDSAPEASGKRATKVSKLYVIFLSYAGEDRRSIVEPLIGWLKAARVDLWDYQADSALTEKISAEVSAQIEGSSLVVFVVTPDFIAKDWTLKEAVLADAMRKDRLTLVARHRMVDRQLGRPEAPLEPHRRTCELLYGERPRLILDSRFDSVLRYLKVLGLPVDVPRQKKLQIVLSKIKEHQEGRMPLAKPPKSYRRRRGPLAATSLSIWLFFKSVPAPALTSAAWVATLAGAATAVVAVHKVISPMLLPSPAPPDPGDVQMFRERSSWTRSLRLSPETVDFEDVVQPGKTAYYTGEQGLVLGGLRFVGEAERSQPTPYLAASNFNGSWWSGACLTGLHGIKVYLPPKVTAFACDMAFSYPFIPGYGFLVEMSNGFTIRLPAQEYPHKTFIGLTSPSPIDWVLIRSDVTFLIINDVSTGIASQAPP